MILLYVYQANQRPTKPTQPKYLLKGANMWSLTKRPYTLSKLLVHQTPSYLIRRSSITHTISNENGFNSSPYINSSHVIIHIHILTVVSYISLTSLTWILEC